jgi:hypothetical protein
MNVTSNKNNYTGTSSLPGPSPRVQISKNLNKNIIQQPRIDQIHIKDRAVLEQEICHIALTLLKNNRGMMLTADMGNEICKNHPELYKEFQARKKIEPDFGLLKQSNLNKITNKEDTDKIEDADSKKEANNTEDKSNAEEAGSEKETNNIEDTGSIEDTDDADDNEGIENRKDSTRILSELKLITLRTINIDENFQFVEGTNIPSENNTQAELKGFIGMLPEDGSSPVDSRIILQFPTFCCISAFLNIPPEEENKIKSIYFGIDKNGNVKGIELNYKQRDRLSNALRGQLQSLSPPVLPGDVNIAFLPVFKNRTLSKDVFIVKLSVQCGSRMLHLFKNKCYICHFNQIEMITNSSDILSLINSRHLNSIYRIFTKNVLHKTKVSLKELLNCSSEDIKKQWLEQEQIQKILENERLNRMREITEKQKRTQEELYLLKKKLEEIKQNVAIDKKC